MESGNAVSPVSVGSGPGSTLEVSKPPVAASSRSATPVVDNTNNNIKIDEATQVAQAASSSQDDAVAVEISSADVAIPRSSGGGDQQKQLTDEQAEQLAAQYEAALNQTAVKFGVSVEKGENRAISFQVIDKETGKVVRQFPADKVVELTAKAGGQVTTGALVDETS